MASGQSWTSPESLAQSNAGYDLRPLSTGEVLDRTFQLYRSRIALFASLAAPPAAVSFISGAIQAFALQGERVLPNGKHLVVNTHPWTTVTISIVAALIYFALYGITQAATTWAVSEIYLGNPAALSSAWKAVSGRWFRYILVVLRQYWSIFWLPIILFVAFGAIVAVNRRSGNLGLSIVMGLLAFLALASLIYSGYVALRVSLAIPAAVLEGLRPNAAVRRSIALLPERKVRIFLLWLLVVAMGFIVGIVISPLAFMAVTAHGVERYTLQMSSLAGSFLSRLLIGPVGAIGLCLFYFDERVRHEGFDIEFLMQRAGGPPPNPAVEGSTSPEPA
ncbi:MAG TPA: hypothetical protein VMD92_19560 [Acidobacteriaceae bacterium]|nr:hypothetical protein [Acidobacteriaceae bacterium]